MTREFPKIEPADQTTGKYAFAKADAPITQCIWSDFDKIPEKEIIEFRSAQAGDEILEIRGQKDDFYLVRKYDDTFGWLHCKFIREIFECEEKWLDEMREHHRNFLVQNTTSHEKWMGKWIDTPYSWGGISLTGIDCSGLVQKFCEEKLGIIVPKNSQNQKKLGRKVSNPHHDCLVAMTNKKTETSHIGIFLDGKIFHAADGKKVICEERKNTEKRYKIDFFIEII